MAEFAQRAASRRNASAAAHVVADQARPLTADRARPAGAALGRLRVALNQSPRAQEAAQLHRNLNPASPLKRREARTPARPTAAPQAHESSSVAQRMIALDIKPHVEMQEDMPALKVLAQLKHFLAKKLSDSDVFLLQEGLDFSRMGIGETLYIAGHGMPGRLYGVPPRALLGMLNDPDKGVPAHIERIVFLVCNAGTLEVEEDTGSSLVSQIAMGLRHPNIGVVGAKGYTFGAPSTAQQGLNRVMPVDLWAIEKASDEDEIASVLSGMAMTNELRAAARRSPEANQALVANTLTFGGAFDSHEQLIKHAKRFLTRKVDIELKLNEAVRQKQPPQQTGADGINSVVAGLKSDGGFGDLVTAQNALYEEFGFFHQHDAYDRQMSLGGAAALRHEVAHELLLNSLSWSERMKIGRELSQTYESEIGAQLQERFLRIVELGSTVTKDTDLVIHAVESAGQVFLQGKYEYAGKQQLQAVAKAKLASLKMSEIAQSKNAGVIFGLVPELDGHRMAIRSLCQHLNESNLFRGLLTYLSDHLQPEKAEEIRRVLKGLEPNVTALRDALVMTNLHDELNAWIHKHA